MADKTNSITPEDGIYVRGTLVSFTVYDTKNGNGTQKVAKIFANGAIITVRWAPWTLAPTMSADTDVMVHCTTSVYAGQVQFDGTGEKDPSYVRPSKAELTASE